MATYKGTLDFEDVGAGAWVLITADGERYTLHGDIPASLRGAAVTVKGTKTGGGFGFAMLGGAAIEVTSVTAG